MPLPGALAGLTRHLPAAVQGGAVPALVAGAAAYSYQERRTAGMHAALNLPYTVGESALPFMVGLGTYFGIAVGVPVAYYGGRALLQRAYEHGNDVRRARTPFSARYEGSEAAYRAQAAGLQSIGSSWAHSRFGSEAGAFARRYGRR